MSFRHFKCRSFPSSIGGGLADFKFLHQHVNRPRCFIRQSRMLERQRMEREAIELEAARLGLVARRVAKCMVDF